MNINALSPDIREKILAMRADKAERRAEKKRWFLPFGKWKGFGIERVPLDYLRWLVETQEKIEAGRLPPYKKPIDPDLYANIKDYLANNTEVTS